MRAERWHNALWAAALGFGAAVGSIGCMVTGLWMMEVIWWQVAAVCLLAASARALCGQGPLRRLPICGIAVLTLILWVMGPLAQSVEYLLYHVSNLYDRGYGWGILRWSDADLTEATMTPALCILGAIIALSVTGSVMRRRSTLPGVLAAVLPVASCVVLTDTVPREIFLFLLLLSMILLLMTQTVRRRDIRQGNRLTAILVLPVALGLGLLFWLMPQENYRGQETAQKLEQLAQQWLTEMPTMETPVPGINHLSVAADVSAKTVKLEQVGPQEPGMTTVMKVVAPESCVLYLRSCAFDYYDGISWTATQTPWAREMEFPQSEGKKQTISLQTVAVHDALYFTYSPVQTENYRNGRAENTEAVTVYTISYAVPTGYDPQWDTVFGNLDQEEMRQYLTLPRETVERAQKILIRQGIAVAGGSAGDIYRTAVKISDFVRSSAEYDLNTQSMPSDETDFAMWFLESSDTGYCVHYASAATVLLRSVGIPARYVTGYLIEAKQDQAVSVKVKDAHAWVECYINGIGWIPLEATASGVNSPVVEATEPENTSATEVVGTEPEETTQVPTYTENTTGTAVETVPVPDDTQTTQPQATQDVEPPFDNGGDSNKLLSILPWLGAILILLGQWRLRVYVRRHRQRTGPVNAQALARWQEAVLLSRLLKRPPEEALHLLAQKARFSDHTLTGEELRQFSAWLNHARNRLRKQPLWKQFFYTVILAIY